MHLTPSGSKHCGGLGPDARQVIDRTAARNAASVPGSITPARQACARRPRSLRRFFRWRADRTTQSRRFENRLLHDPAEARRIGMESLHVRCVCIELVDARPFGQGKQPVGHGLHLFMQPTIERSVRGNENELGTET